MAKPGKREFEKNLKADKSKKRDKKIKPDTGANIPLLFFYTALGTILMSSLGMVFGVLGFLFAPPLTCLAAALAFGLVCMFLYRLFLLTSETRSVPAARLFVGASSLVVFHFFMAGAISVREVLGPDAVDFSDILYDLGEIGRKLFAGPNLYAVHPLRLWEAVLYYRDIWVFLALLALIAVVGLAQLSVSGVRKRSLLSLRAFSGDLALAEGLEEPQAEPEPEGGKKKKKRKKKKKEEPEEEGEEDA